MRDLPTIAPCTECGMPCEAAEYHPYAACLMYMACHDSKTVRENLAAVCQRGLDQRLAAGAEADEKRTTLSSYLETLPIEEQEAIAAEAKALAPGGRDEHDRQTGKTCTADEALGWLQTGVTPIHDGPQPPAAPQAVPDGWRSEALALRNQQWFDDFEGLPDNPKLAYIAGWNEALDCLLASPEPSPPSGWRPISEAPKDGTVILLAGSRGVHPGYWLDNSQDEYPWAGWRSLERVEIAHADRLTHFMPLPPAPSSEQPKEFDDAPNDPNEGLPPWA